ncbi:MAG TPA: glutaredoxin family protein [Opitutus sp.]|nr:glutaredoxin family protein [Opitutus sp.]
MQTDEYPVLYIKSDCPWCTAAVDYLSQVGITRRELNVTLDPAARDEMERISGQDKAPVLDWHGRVLADFDVDELKSFLRAQNVRLEDS